MRNRKIENKIKERFNELSDIFPEDIKDDDPRVQEILKFLAKIKGKTILDAGCGKGRFSKILANKGGVVTGVDLSNELLKVAKNKIKNANFIIGNILDLEFLDNSFDYIICVEALEHVPDTDKAIKEMVRVLKKDGKIIIIDKNKLSLHNRLFLPNMFVKKYMEFFNKWMYPRNFPFTEKWFFPTEAERILKKYCKYTKKEYLKDSKKKLFDVFNLFIAWEGIK